MEINKLKISGEDPFLNANKWNSALEFSENFENILDSILGNKFKGIYKPEKQYNKGDYVWFNGECYLIVGKNAIELKKEQLENTKTSYFKENGSYIIRDGKINYYKNGTYKIINITNVDDFVYKETKPYFFAYKNNDIGSRIYKIPFEGKVEALNANFETSIKILAIDDFYGYAVTTENKLKKFQLQNPTEHTSYQNVNFTSNHDIVSMTVNDENIFLLNSNSDLLTVSKDGGVLKTTSLREHISNANLSKVTITDNNIMIVTDGESKIKVFVVENKQPRFSYSLDINIGTIKSLNYSNSYISMSSDSIVATSLASEYQLAPASLRKLISNISTLEIRNAILSLDFGKGQLVSNGETIIEPIGFQMNQANTVNGVYKDAVNKVQFVGNRGIQTDTNKLVYSFENLNDKLIICEFDSAKSNVNFLKAPLENKSVILPATRLDIKGVFKTAYSFKNNIATVTVSQNDDILEVFEVSGSTTYSSELTFASTGSVVLNKVIIVPVSEKVDVDFLLGCSYIIPDYYKNSYLPTPANNASGVSFLKSNNRSITSDETGVKVNFSSNYLLNDPEAGLNTVGAKNLYDTIKALETKLDGNFSLKTHKHKFSELLEVPIAGLGGKKGIVDLVSSVSSDSDNTAATPKSVKTAYNEAVNAKNIANTKLNASAGTTDGFYLKYSAGVSGNVYDNFKTGKTGEFNGSSLSNQMPWGSHSWKYYYTNSHANSAGYTGIISLDFDGGEMGYTSICNGTLKPWNRVWSSFNFDPNSKANNHSHPYLSQNGGTLNGDLKIGGGNLTLSKRGTVSRINFDAQSNDPGFIQHAESNNSSNMIFSVSDDRARQDYFSWGSTPGGGYSQCAYMYTDGYFHTDGDIHSSGNITAFSDERLKENIIPIDNALELTEKLNGVIFNRKDNGLRQTGLIAQDVLNVMPEAVSMNEEGYYSVNYGSLVGMLVESIKELKKEIEILKKSR